MLIQYEYNTYVLVYRRGNKGIPSYTLYLKMIKLKFNNQYYHMRIVNVKYDNLLNKRKSDKKIFARGDPGCLDLCGIFNQLYSVLLDNQCIAICQ